LDVEHEEMLALTIFIVKDGSMLFQTEEPSRPPLRLPSCYALMENALIPLLLIAAGTVFLLLGA
jgi:hypothetical protein